jgi:hypothetical protein
MSAVTRPRGPLPARVYWFRRSLVLVVAFALVYGFAHLLGGRSDTPEARPVEAAVGSTTSSAPATGPAQPLLPGEPGRTGGLVRPGADGKGGKGGKAGATGKSGRAAKSGKHAKHTPKPTPLAVPTGPCSADDVQAGTPKVAGTAYAGGPVTFKVRLHTTTSPACWWKVDPHKLVVRLISGSDRIWSTQDCPRAVPTDRVVVRTDH